MRSFLFRLALGAAILTAGCGDDEPNANNVIEIPDSGDNNSDSDMDMDASDDDAGDDADTGGENNNNSPSCVDVLCDPGQKCVRGDCVAENAKLACDEVKDEGILNIAQPYTLTGDTTSFVDTFDTTCVQTINGFSGPENVFKFQVSSDALMRLTLTSSAQNVDWLMEIRTGGCETGTAAVCSDPEQFQFVAKAGVDYYLVVEPAVGFDTGPFQVAMQFQEQTCTPGERTCVNDTLEVCGSGTYACAQGCSMGACDGDACANAIDVTAAMSFSGDTQGYTSVFDFANEASCSPSMQSGIATPGPELVLRLPGLTAGQVITVDASMNDDNDNAIFVLDDCVEPAKACLAGRDLGDTLSYTVVADGDHFVVIDKLSGSPKSFRYMIDIQ